jgi:L-fucose mutarotase/ribose pyranase (RbsD/FucU family)
MTKEVSEDELMKAVLNLFPADLPVDQKQIKEAWNLLVDAINTNHVAQKFKQDIDDHEKYGGTFDNPSPHPDK